MRPTPDRIPDKRMPLTPRITLRNLRGEGAARSCHRGPVGLVRNLIPHGQDEEVGIPCEGSRRRRVDRGGVHRLPRGPSTVFPTRSPAGRSMCPSPRSTNGGTGPDAPSGAARRVRRGTPRVWEDLVADGWRVSKKSVAASMARQGLQGRSPKRKRRSLTPPARTRGISPAARHKRRPGGLGQSRADSDLRM